MKLVREHINFERGIDPKKAMGIGIITWDKLEEGNIITNTKEIYRYFEKKSLSFSQPQWMHSDKPIKTKTYFVVTSLHREKNYLELELVYTFLSLKHVVLLSQDWIRLNLTMTYSLDGPISEWDSHFRIIQPQEIKELT